MNEIVSIDSVMSQSGDIDTVERLMVLRREIKSDEARRAFQTDFSRLQAVLPAVSKKGRCGFQSSKGGKVQYNYVKIDDLTEALKPFMIELGFSFTFKQRETANGIAVQCVVMHHAGHREETDMSAPLDVTGNKNPMQALASTMSYLKRLTFTSAFGISVVDGPVSLGEPKEMLPQVKPLSHSDKSFHANFKSWQSILKEGKKTPQELFDFLKSKGVDLSKDQKEMLILCY